MSAVKLKHSTFHGQPHSSVDGLYFLMGLFPFSRCLTLSQRWCLVLTGYAVAGVASVTHFFFRFTHGVFQVPAWYVLTTGCLHGPGVDLCSVMLVLYYLCSDVCSLS